jgi:hypothetical protein
MTQFGGKNTKKSSSSDSKRHFTVVMGGKEHGLYVSSTPSSAAKKAVTKLCSANKSKKVQFEIREITQGSKKKTYGPYTGHIEKIKEPIELKGRVIRYKPFAKLSGKSSVKKRGIMKGGEGEHIFTLRYKFEEDDRSDWIEEVADLVIELEKLKEGGIFRISDDISQGDETTIQYDISFINYSEAVKNANYQEQLEKLIELIKKFMKYSEHITVSIQDRYSTNSNESNSNQSNNNSSNKYNIFLNELAEKIKLENN